VRRSRKGAKKLNYRIEKVPISGYDISGLFSSIFWEQGFDKVRESSRILKLFEQFDVQFRKWRILLVFTVILVQSMLVLSYMYMIYYD
jgi:hypothetical protein